VAPIPSGFDLYNLAEDPHETSSLATASPITTRPCRSAMTSLTRNRRSRCWA